MFGRQVTSSFSPSAQLSNPFTNYARFCELDAMAFSTQKRTLVMKGFGLITNNNNAKSSIVQKRGLQDHQFTKTNRMHQ